MASRIDNCHDAFHAPVNSDPNRNRDMMESLRNNFLPDNSGSTINRYPDGNPLWGEVTKRYQQIIEKEYKLLNTRPLYYDGQTIPQNSPLSSAPRSILKRGAIFKHPQYKESRKRNATTLKPDAEQVDTSDFMMIKERGLCSKNVREVEGTAFPKIVEVYSLNFPNIQAKEMENRKRRYQQGVPSCIEEKTWKDKTADSNVSTSCFSPKNPGANIVIDLTVDEEEETTLCSSDDTNQNNKYQTETELAKLKENKNDKETEFKLIKGNTSKRKRVLPRRKKITTKTTTMQKQSETNEMAASKNRQHSKESQQLEEPNRVNMSSIDGNEIFVHNQNNNVVTRENVVKGEEKHFMCPNSSNGDRSLLNMSYRDHKITDLKAKLAQQEEELAKLKALKRHEAVVKENPQTLSDHESVENSRQKENTRIELDSQKREDLDLRSVNIEDICQHVIKSFNVFNARVYKDNMVENEGVNCRQISTKRNGVSCQVTANGYNGHGPGNKQDEFLFQVGLRRKSFT